MVLFRGSLMRGTHEALAWPALKREISVETPSGALKRSFPRINAGAPTANLDKSDSQPFPSTSSHGTLHGEPGQAGQAGQALGDYSLRN